MLDRLCASIFEAQIHPVIIVAMRKLFGMLFLFAGLSSIVACSGALDWSIAALRLALEEPPQSLPSPIDGPRPIALRDSWGATRSGGRKHEGIDIFARKGTPVLSTTRGLVFRVGQNSLGGNVVWIFGPGRQMHYYAHLDRFGEVETGDLVKPGDVIGYVGNTGNAHGTPPHLHYGLYAPSRGAINPFPLLRKHQLAS
jgi:murein DD-endopeptidase MepM/ murein hydrolase activator NlpD